MLRAGAVSIYELTLECLYEHSLSNTGRVLDPKPVIKEVECMAFLSHE